MSVLDWVWLVPALPLAGFLILTLGPTFTRRAVFRIALATSTAAAGVSACMAPALELPGHVQVLWTWMDLEGFAPRVAFYVDALSMVMMLVVTGVGALVHLYATQYMAEEADYQRFFAFLNLFLFAMLVLVLADDFLLLFLGWEGVGLCSYLLIGFWYRDPANGYAARKAFIVNRIGDTAMIAGLCLLFAHLGTLDIQEVLRRASSTWTVGAPTAAVLAALLLGGAVGKSAQIPLQVWLPDAMAGPTPVSALIHSATMVTAGVYLIARTQALFALAPMVQRAILLIGTATLLLAATSALVQRDIKRVFAFSTISQLGYMFVALGAGAAGAAIFHLVTHASFKALLFLTAGALMYSLHHEKDLHQMGGLRRDLPLVFWSAVIGAASLSGLPFVTAGFFSKDQILVQAWRSPNGGMWLLLAGLLGSMLTALYSFRVVYLAFFGEKRREVARVPGWRMNVPLAVLAGLSICAGWMGWPVRAEEPSWFARLIHTAIPPPHPDSATGAQATEVEILAAVAALLGLAWASLLYGPLRERVKMWAGAQSAPTGRPVFSGRLAGWIHRWAIHQPSAAMAGAVRKDVLDRFYERFVVRPFLTLAGTAKGDVVDRAYERVVVQPFLRMAQANREDRVDRLYEALTRLVERAAVAAHEAQNGRVRWYAAVLAAGAVGLTGLVMVLA